MSKPKFRHDTKANEHSDSNYGNDSTLPNITPSKAKRSGKLRLDSSTSGEQPSTVCGVRLCAMRVLSPREHTSTSSLTEEAHHKLARQVAPTDTTGPPPPVTSSICLIVTLSEQTMCAQATQHAHGSSSHHSSKPTSHTRRSRNPESGPKQKEWCSQRQAAATFADNAAGTNARRSPVERQRPRTYIDKVGSSRMSPSVHTS